MAMNNGWALDTIVVDTHEGYRDKEAYTLTDNRFAVFPITVTGAKRTLWVHINRFTGMILSATFFSYEAACKAAEELELVGDWDKAIQEGRSGQKVPFWREARDVAKKYGAVFTENRAYLANATLH